MQHQLNKGQIELLEEAKVRGLCAAHSADMEGLLLRLILYCIIDDPKEAHRKFSKLTLGKKLEWAKRDLKKYYPDRFRQHQADFNALSKFNTFRGHLIHCDMVWRDETYTEFFVVDIQKIKGEWRVIPINYTKSDVAKKLADFGKQIINFAQTTKDIIDIVAKKYPELNKSSIA